jgi:ABC-type Fe3+/spermidine/putrescine transport system ATPase subunit
VRIGDDRFRGRGVRWPAELAEPREPGQPVEVVLRPEGLRLMAAEADASLTGSIEERRFTGEATFYVVRLESGQHLLVKGEVSGPEVGARVGVGRLESGPLPRCFPVDPEDAEA